MPFKQFNKRILDGLNRLRRVVNKLDNMRGDGFIEISQTGSGTVIGMNLSKVRERVAKNGSGDGGVSSGSSHKAYVKTAPGAVTTVTCFLDTDTTGTEVTVNCSVIGGGGSIKLNSATPRLIDASLIFVEDIDGEWWCTAPFTATEDCTCEQADAVFNSVTIESDQKLTLSGVGGSTFIRHNSTDGEVEHNVEGTEVVTW